MFRQKLNKLVIIGLVLGLFFGNFIFENKIARAQYIVVTDPKADAANKAAKAQDWSLSRLFNVTLPQMAAKTFNSVLSTALKQMAVDSANWIATGAKGQGPMFLTQGWGPFLSNIGDVAAGQMIDSFAKETAKSLTNGTVDNFSFCNPASLTVSLKIGLGLRAQERPELPLCTFSKMSKNINQYVNDKQYLSALQSSFDPTSNDVGLALSLNDITRNAKIAYKDAAGKERTVDKGWLRVNSLVGDSYKNRFGGGLASDDATMDEAMNFYQDTPGFVENRFTSNMSLAGERMLVGTGDALVDAANVFLNQLAVKSLEELMKNLGKNGSSGIAGYGAINLDALTNKEAGGYNPGVAGAERKSAKLLKATFNTKADYDILSQLSMCPDQNNVGPTDCVLGESLKQAIQGKKTVAQAIESDSSLGEMSFAIDSQGKEPLYTIGIPYRSMIILRKYRILPVGWELAGQYMYKAYKSRDTSSTATSFESVTLKDMVGCFSDTDEFTSGFDAEWCRGLVDPNWVLKAPQNYCKKQGFGEQIVNTTDDSNGNVSVARKDGYCADEQSCVKEGENGACEAFGYCTEERRTWNFGQDVKSCEPVYNTCQAYTNAKTNTKVSYLQNTLDYSNCNSDMVGCSSYNNKISFDSATKKYTYNNVAAAVSSSESQGLFYFDDGAKSCAAADEGCHQFIRTKGGLGANLLQNSDFEDAALPEGFAAALGAKVAGGYNSTSSFQLIAGPHTTAVTVGRNVFDQAFTLSFYAKGCSDSDKVSFKNDTGDVQSFFSTTTSDWSQVSLTRVMAVTSVNPGLGSELEINWSIASPSCTIDNIKLEYAIDQFNYSLSGTGYSKYGERAVISEKLVPEYLKASCTGDTTDPEECKNFARTCSEDELGCELYTAKDSGLVLPAKVKSLDYCDKTCVGYKSYIQSASTFDSTREEHFIPDTAAKCSLDVAGCDEFTNLDGANGGGEKKEYYTYLKQCVKTDEPLCTDFYTWQGSSDTGFRLVTEKLKAISDKSEPAVTSADSAECNEAIYRLSPSAPGYNPDCLQFYDKDGKISYHLHEKTITCSDNCHPFRRTAINTDPVVTETNCHGTDRAWNGTECVVCKEGGTITDDQTCIYQAIPNEGRTCTAAQNGCREYVGTQGENMRTLFNDTFNGGVGAWQSGGAVNTSGDNLRRDTKSLQVSNESISTYRSIGQALTPGKTYVLSFLAKGSGNLHVYTDKKVDVSRIGYDNIIDIVRQDTPFSDTWAQYTLSFVASSTYNYTGDELLVFDQNISTNNLYLDNIELTEVTDRYYLLQNSWQTPEVCDQDLNGKPSYLYMLNCDAYIDSDDLTHYLRSFSGLCKESGAGCELMLDTHNSDSPLASTVQGVTTPADNYAYVVYDKTKLCEADQKGCSRFGLQHVYAGSEITYEDKFIINNPDDYSTAMCGASNVGCESYSGTDGSENYFKNPFDDVCEYRTVGSTTAWYKRVVKRCNSIGNICSADSDCLSGQKCSSGPDNISCSVTNSKTLGDGTGSVEQPSTGWVGICQESVSTCSEIIDPVGQISPNLLMNPNFENLDGRGPGTGWKDNNGGSRELTDTYSQDLRFDVSTLYAIGGVGEGSLSLSCNESMNTVESGSNNLVSIGTSLSIDLSENAGKGTNRSFIAGRSAKCTLSVDNTIGGDIYVRKLAVNYKLLDGIDIKSCNNLVNYSNGCIPFNLRQVNGGAMSSLSWDANISYLDPYRAPIAGVNNNSNKVVKVSPDRTCNKWLSGGDAIDDAEGNLYFYNLQLCSAMDSGGFCENPLIDSSGPKKWTGTALYGDWQNYSGYAKVGYDQLDSLPEYRGGYGLSVMNEEGEAIEVKNGDFENSGKLTPVTLSDGKTEEYYADSWSLSSTNEHGPKLAVNISDYVLNKTEPYSGSSYVVLAPGESAVSESGISVQANDSDFADYYVSFAVVVPGGTTTVKVISNTGEVCGTRDISNIDKWQMQYVKFACAKAGSVEITLEAGNTSAFFDDVSVSPMLRTSCTGSDCLDEQYTAPSCRLYPADDAKSCKYQKENGNTLRGIYGYCLQHDIAPGNPDACLMWWPVDFIRGDTWMADSMAGGSFASAAAGNMFNTGQPEYYCAEARSLVPVVKMRKLLDAGSIHAEPGDGCEGNDGHDCLVNESVWESLGFSSGLLGGNSWYGIAHVHDVAARKYISEYINKPTDPVFEYYTLEKPYNCYSGSPYAHTDQYLFTAKGSEVMASTESGYSWYVYDPTKPYLSSLTYHGLGGQCKKNYLTNYNSVGTVDVMKEIKFWDPKSGTDQGALYDNQVAFCERYAQVAGNNGENKAWTKRVSAASDYLVKLVDSISSAVISLVVNVQKSPFGMADVGSAGTWSAMRQLNSNLTVPAYRPLSIPSQFSGITAYTGVPFDMTPSAFGAAVSVSRRVTNTVDNYCVAYSTSTGAVIKFASTTKDDEVVWDTNDTSGASTVYSGASYSFDRCSSSTTEAEEYGIDYHSNCKCATSTAVTFISNVNETSFTGSMISSGALGRCCISGDCTAPTGSVTDGWCIKNLTGVASDPYGNNKWICPATYACESFPDNDINTVKSNTRRIFAKSYGGYLWDEASSMYKEDGSLSWDLPTNKCTAPRTDNDYCFIEPVVNNLSITPNILHTNGRIYLKFSVTADENQGPITNFKVDWRNGSSQFNSSSGSFYANGDYTVSQPVSYNTLSQRSVGGDSDITCVDDPDNNMENDYCEFKPRVQAKDNWDKASAWVEYDGMVRVYRN